MIVSFIPMLCIAAAYYYMNRADPDCGTTFTWVTQGDGPEERLDGGLGDHRRRRAGHAQPRLRRRPVHVPALRLGRRRRQQVGGARRRDRLDRRHDLDLLGRRRALGPHAADPAVDRDLHARRCSPSSRSTRCTPRARPARSSRRSRGSTHSPSRRQRAHRRGAARQSSSTGAGTRASRSTRRPRTRPRPPASAAIVSTFMLVGIYVLVTTAAQAFAGPQAPDRQPRRHLRAARQAACSAAGSTSY